MEALILFLLTTTTLVMSIACQEAQDALPGAHTIVDKSIQIESGNSSYIDLRKGEYTVRISSDDAVTVEWIGDNLTGYNTDSPTKSYNVNVQASDSTTLKIHNPSGWFSNPTAIVHVKIVDED